MTITTQPLRTGRLLAPDFARGFMLLLIAMAYAGAYVGAGFGVNTRGEPWPDRAASMAPALFLDNRAFSMFAMVTPAPCWRLGWPGRWVRWWRRGWSASVAGGRSRS